MCGILAVFGKPTPSVDLTELSRTISHRGPDQRAQRELDAAILCSERLSILDPEHGQQPHDGCGRGVTGVHNGEVYNHLELRDRFLGGHTFSSTSDTETLVHLYEELGSDFVRHLDGQFAFAISQGERALVARDPFGIKPLYWGEDDTGRMWFASELKPLLSHCQQPAVFPPATTWTPEDGFVRFHEPAWKSSEGWHDDLASLPELLSRAVQKRFLSDVPFGVLLSGGLDSSLVAACAQRLLPDGQRLRTFSVGLTGGSSADLDAARRVAGFLGTEHHEVTFTAEEGLAAVPHVVSHLETYDQPSIRAGVPAYMITRYVRQQGVKVLLSGEGSDEIFGGYLYFHLAPNARLFHEETVHRLEQLHLFDLLRADKAAMANGVEIRVPFLDRDFVDHVLTLDPALRAPQPGPLASGKPIEKWAIRQAFAELPEPLLPSEVLWRAKEQFSDGVGYGWLDALRDRGEELVSDDEFGRAAERFAFQPPRSKEEHWYRTLFEQRFGAKNERLVDRWLPKWQENPDASGRANPLHPEQQARPSHSPARRLDIVPRIRPRSTQRRPEPGQLAAVLPFK